MVYDYWGKRFSAGLVDQRFQLLKELRIMSHDCSSCKDYSQELLHFNRKQLEK